MPTPFRTVPTLAAALAALAMAAPSFAQSRQATGAATPQAAVDQLQASIDKGDPAGAMGVMTPSGRKLFAKDMVLQTLMFLAFMDPDDPMPGGPKDSPEALAAKKKAYAQLKTDVAAAFKPVGMEGALGQPVMKAEPIIDKGLETADTIGLATTLYAAVLKAAPAFGKADGQLKLPLKAGPFTALTVNGDIATVKSGPKTVKFEKIDGRWYLNFPTPEPVEP
jgi:hypothetical protein